MSKTRPRYAQSVFPLLFPSRKAAGGLSGSGDHKGSILIIALWTICLLAVFAVTLGYQTRQKLFFVQRLNERDATALIAEAGIKKAICELAKEEVRPFDSLRDKWSSNPAAFKDINVGDGVFSVCYNYPDETGKCSLTLWGLVDEERKINVNSADAEVLSRLIQLVLGLDETEAKAMAAAIVDWRDSDSALSETGEGAEDTYYFGLSLPYEAKDSAFEVLEELLLVKDMTSAAFERLSPYLTVFGNGRVNINTASGTVLMALGLDKPLAEKVLAFRRGRDETEATADDNVFESTDEIVPKLSEFYRLTANEIAQLSSVAGSSLAVGSEYFLVRCEASLVNRKNKRIVNSVINKSGAILSWNES